MPDSLVLELQRDAMESKAAVSDLLRKALVLAEKLEIGDFQAWIAKELAGYVAGDTIPLYRQVHSQIKVHNPYHGWQPVLIHDEEMAQAIASLRLFQPISELENLFHSSSNSKNSLVMPLPPGLERSLMEAAHIPLQPMFCIDRSQIHGVLDAVRNTILSWSLALEKQGILGEGMTFSKAEKIKAKDNVSIHIKNFNGVLGDVTNSAVNQDFRSVKNNWSALEERLLSSGIPSHDVKSLKEAMDADGQPVKPGTFGKQVSAWIGKMVGEAASGAWKMATEKAGGLLFKLLAAHYGWPKSG